jgi:nicotinamidase-related amidase
MGLEGSYILVADAQKGIWPYLEQHHEVAFRLNLLLKVASCLKIPYLFSGQEHLGAPIKEIEEFIDDGISFRSSFSLLNDPQMRASLYAKQVTQWIIVGSEAHISILQTARNLKKIGDEVIVLNDVMASRSIFDFSTAIGEMKEEGIRISSLETICFELLESIKHPQFNEVKKLLKPLQYPQMDVKKKVLTSV